MDVGKREDRLLDEISTLLHRLRLLEQDERNTHDYLTTVLSVIRTQSEDAMRAGIDHLIRQLQPAEFVTNIAEVPHD